MTELSGPSAHPPRPAPAKPRSVEIVFRHGWGVPAWEKRGRRSPVPGAWPYGLDQLAQDGRVILTREVDDLRRFRRLVAERRGVRRHRPHAGSPAAALCWDEMTAPGMVARVPAQRLYSGVIWATDQLTRGSARPGHVALLRSALLEMDALWVLSRPQAEFIAEWLGPAAPPVRMVQFGIDGEFFSASPYPERPLVVSAGNDRDRDIDTLFAALTEICRARPDVECVVQTRSSIPAPAGVTTVAELTHVDLRELYARASVVAVATRPNMHVSGMTVLLEAQATARPVVVSRTDGITDYVGDGITGRLVEPQDPGALADAILDVLSDPDQAAVVGAAGRQAIETRHTTSHLCTQLRAIVDGT